MARPIKVNIVGDVTKLKEALGEAETEVGGWGDRMGPAVAAAGVAAGAALVGSFMAGMGQEDVEASIQSQLGISPERASELGDISSGLYRDAWGDSLEEVGNAVTTVEAALGDALSDSELETITAQAIAMGDAFGIEAAESIQLVDQLLNQGLVSSAQEGMDLLTASFQAVPEAMRGPILDAASEYGPFFEQLGMDGEQAMAMFIAASENGEIALDKTGDALKELTIRATDGSSASVEALQAMGLNAEEIATMIAAGGDEAALATQQIVEGLSSIEDPALQSQAAIALMGTPIEDLSADDLPAFLDAIAGGADGLGDFSGSAQEMADTIGGTTSNKLESFKRNALGALADFGQDVLIPAFESVLGAFEDIGRWMDDNQPIVIALGAALGAMGLVIIGSLVPSVISWAAAQWAAAAAVIATHLPIIAIVAAIGLLVAAVVYAYQEWDWFRAAVDAVADFFTETLWPILQDVFSWMQENIPPIIQAIIDVVTRMWEIWRDNILPIYEAVWAFIRDNILPIFASLASFIIDTVVPAFMDIVGFIRDDVIPFLQKMWEKAMEMKDKVGEAISGIVTFFTDLPGNIIEAFGDGFSWLKDKMTEAKDWVSNRVDDVINFISNIGSTLAGLISNPFQWVLDKATAMKDWVLARVDELVEYIKSIPSKIGGALDSISGGVFSAAVDTFTNAAGGPIASTGVRLVGERGPEKVVLPRGSTVLPAHESGGMSSSITVHANTNADPDEIARAIGWMMRNEGVI